MDFYSRVYARQEYLTPGAAETVAWFADAAQPNAGSRILEVASGKGEAACSLATRFGCRVTAVDRSLPFLEYVRGKVRDRGLADRVGLLYADGRQLPLPDASHDAAYCIGAPSIVGTEECLREMRRAVRPGGAIVVSDITWRQKPSGPLGDEWGWIATYEPRNSADDYAATIAACGLDLQDIRIHPRAAWEEYERPMLQVAAEARAQGDTAFADQVEEGAALERRAVEAFWEYATFIVRRAS
jgi:cyclopropane fatty-acyl-phospholipid synthase-like methyltransferase